MATEMQQTWVNLSNRKITEICAALTRLPRTRMTDTVEERYELITRRLQEVLGADIIKAILAEGRTPKCYWGQSLDQSLVPVESLTALQDPHPQENVRTCSLSKEMTVNKRLVISPYWIFCAFDQDCRLFKSRRRGVLNNPIHHAVVI